jgi:hypothetical protein
MAETQAAETKEKNKKKRSPKRYPKNLKFMQTINYKVKTLGFFPGTRGGKKRKKTKKSKKKGD